jgi:D-alanyl-lipoteichoic acid acyltransferase DltB (MBOAT superfamily)
VIFNSVTYLAFLVLVVSTFWLLPTRLRLWLIFLSSLTFYGFWRPEFVSLMLFSAGADYWAAKKIEVTDSQLVRRRWLALSLTVNLSLLLYFKYLLFFVDNAVIALNFFGIEVQAPIFSIVLPLGISFYTFQTISYVVDVYRKLIPAEKDFLLYGCFVTFFPQLVAGPILRANELLAQLEKRPIFSLDMFASGIHRIILGLFLKVVIADNIAPLVDEGFAAPVKQMSAIDVLTLAFLFGFQIYCDFSAYSHIALGSARLMGISFPENFQFPYISRSPKEFWQRWHISLSSWVRDYLYLPLIGARVQDRSIGGLEAQVESKRGRHPAFALFVTWGIMGFWHGANWTFVFWGLYHASFIFIYRATEGLRSGLPTVVRDVGGWVVTLLVCMLSWIPFRARNLSDALEMYAKLLQPSNWTWLGMRENNYLVAALLMCGFVLCYGAHRHRHLGGAQTGALAFCIDTILIGIASGLVFIFLRPISQFIYFQF